MKEHYNHIEHQGHRDSLCYPSVTVVLLLSGRARQHGIKQFYRFLLVVLGGEFKYLPPCANGDVYRKLQ